MQSVKIICVGKLKDAFFRDASDEYMKRLKAFCKAEIIEIPQVNLPDDPSDAQIDAALEKEAENIIKKIPAGSTVVAMCVEGKQFSSEELAERAKKISEDMDKSSAIKEAKKIYEDSQKDKK